MSRSRFEIRSVFAKSSEAASRSRWLNSYQWYGNDVGAASAVQVLRKGSDKYIGFPSASNCLASSSFALLLLLGCLGKVSCSRGGRRGGGENSFSKCVVSSSSISRRLSGSSHGGGIMFILLCLLSRSASQSGSVVRLGGVSGFVGPCGALAISIRDGKDRWEEMSASHLHGCQRTPSKSSRSSRWRGTIVTSSISQMKATSEGSSPEGYGKAILPRDAVSIPVYGEGVFDSSILGKEQLRWWGSFPQTRLSTRRIATASRLVLEI